MARILSLDIETTDLGAGAGHLVLCAAWKWLHSPKVHGVHQLQFNVKDPLDDRPILERVSDVICEADMLVTWFGSGFDVPFLNAQLIKHGMPVLPPVKHWDGWKVAKRKMRYRSNSLAHVATALGVEEKKPVLSWEVWARAMRGHKPAMKELMERCKADTRILEELYRKMAVLDQPLSLAAFEGADVCPTCGEDALTKRGFHYNKVTKAQRYQCGACGSWSHGRPEKIEGVEVR